MVKADRPVAKTARPPGIDRGDHVYVQHDKRGPMAVRVTACGADGLTGECDRKESHQVPWDRVLGHKARLLHTYKVADQGADGAILEAPDGRRRYLAGYQPQPDSGAAQPAPGRDETDDPIEGGMDKLRKASAAGPTLILLKAKIAGQAGLSLKDVADKAGHRTKRWTKTGQDAPAVPHGAPIEHGQVVAFRHGDVGHQGKVVASGADGVTVEDADGKTHQVRHEHLVTGGGQGEAGKQPDKPAEGDAASGADSGTVPGDGGGQVPPDQFSASDIYAKFDDPNVTPEQILSGFPPDTAAKITSTEAEIAEQKPTIEIFKKNGKYTPERSKLHAQIISHIISPERVQAAKPAAGQAPTFTILGGRGGSGKSKLAGLVYDPAKAIVLDADEIKGFLPEYKGKQWNAATVHEESGDIFDAITDAAQDLGLNIVHDATMKTPAKAVALVDRFKGAKYRVEAHYMFLPRQEAAKRAVARFLSATKRFVPPAVVLSNTKNESSFDAIKDKVDAWSFRDNNVAQGDDPRLISEKTDGSGDGGPVRRHGLPAGKARNGSDPAGLPASQDKRARWGSESGGRGGPHALKKALQGPCLILLRAGTPA